MKESFGILPVVTEGRTAPEKSDEQGRSHERNQEKEEGFYTD